jgi:hypothetical protein
MANITRIDVQLTTASASSASTHGIGSEGTGTNGDVYIGIAGREFYIDSKDPKHNDFESASSKVYVLGNGGNIMFEEQNDPRKPQLVTEDLSKYPVYLRFEPSGSNPDWNVERVTVKVNPGHGEIRFDNARLVGSPDIWLGQRMGKFVYLSKS